MNYDLTEIGKRIDMALSKKGASRTTIGKILGVGAGAVGRYIRGESDAGSVGLKKIADYCNVPMDWLITGIDPYEKKQIETQLSKNAADFSGNIITLSGEEFAHIMHLRDMPEEDRKGIMRTADLAWAKAKGLL